MHPESAPTNRVRKLSPPTPSPSRLGCCDGGLCIERYPWRSSDPTLDTHQHVTRCRQDDEGDDEKNKAERDQRGGIEIAKRFRELVGDGRRNGGGGRQQRG